MIFFTDYRISDEEKNNLLKIKDSKLILIPKCENLYPAIYGHTDIQLNIIDKKNRLVIVQKDINKNFLNELCSNKINYVLSKSSLSSKYPQDVFLNAAILDNYLIHNLKYTDENLLLNLKDKTKINVNQGYTRCSLLPLNEKSCITSDISIYNALKEYDFNVLYVPSKDIILPHLDYGFIGGTGGMIDKTSIAFFGSLDYFDCGKEVYDFLYSLDIKPIYLYNGKLIDRGSLISI